MHPIGEYRNGDELRNGGDSCGSRFERQRPERAADGVLQRCEAAFYLGQAALLTGRREEAAKEFRAAASSEARGSFAKIAAQAELARLQKDKGPGVTAPSP